MKRRKYQRHVWIVGYKCGCSADFAFRREVLDYCSEHGADRNELFKVDIWHAERAIKK